MDARHAHFEGIRREKNPRRWSHVAAGMSFTSRPPCSPLSMVASSRRRLRTWLECHSMSCSGSRPDARPISLQCPRDTA